MTAADDLLDDLQWRGLIAVSTDLGALREALDAGPVTYYCGFDPTAPSLHTAPGAGADRCGDCSRRVTGRSRWSAARPA